MRFRLLRRDCHHLRAAPAKGPHIAIGDVIRCQYGHLGRIDLLVGNGNVKIKHLAGGAQTFGMFRASKNGAAVGTLALEHKACIMQTVAEGVGLGVTPIHHFTIEPD